MQAQMMRGAGPQRGMRNPQEEELKRRAMQQQLLQRQSMAQPTQGLQNQWLAGMRNTMQMQKTMPNMNRQSETASRKNLLTQIGGLGAMR